MRLVSYTQGAKGPVRVGFLRDGFAGAPLADLERCAGRLGVPGIPKSPTVRGLLSLGTGFLGRLSKAAAAFWKEFDRSAALRRTAGVRPSAIRFLPPIPDPEKVICIGQNYIDHCREQNAPIPKAPILFAKFPTTLTGHLCPVRLPLVAEKVDFEAELAVVIGREGRNIPEAKAYGHVAGYMPLNDVSARDLQYSDGQWVRGKSCDTFAPCGPALVTRDEVPDPQNLRIGLILNGQTMQDSSTSNLIFNVPCLIAFISRSITLRPGDIISTGTPPGVGCFRKPPVFLKPGDAMTVWIEGLGRLTSPVEVGQ